MIAAHLGRCVGCNHFGRLHGPRNDACEHCLRRCTLRFLELAARVRVDPEFAAACYRELPAAWRAKFEVTFGVPPGC